ncbi:MAG: ABC transporter permease subunit [Treponema sp.]|jgi:putative aldouronate transport system permease protein|nr:ABC transporter permease subunit [Treponema sp.]
MKSALNGQSKAAAAWKYFKKMRYLYLLLVPAVVYYIIFKYIPMYGVTIAFKNFNFAKGIMGSPWIGLENFKYLFSLDNFYKVFGNSIFLSLLRLLWGFPIPIILALLLNEMRGARYKKAMQTIIYLPHFISWVVVGGIVINFLSPTWGVVNSMIKATGGEPVFFLAKEEYFRSIVVVTDIWKGAGWGTIIYLAALTGISPELYEAAIVDGANKLQRLWYITLPCIKTTIVLTLILRMGSIMNNGFEQIFVLQNTQNLNVSEVFETWVYRLGLLNGRYSFATTVGLFTSLVGMAFLLGANFLAKKLGEESIF